MHYSNSIIVGHGNTLNFQRKFFLDTVEDRRASPSKNSALDPQEKYPQLEIYPVSATIGIDRSILDVFWLPSELYPVGKIPSRDEERRDPKSTELVLSDRRAAQDQARHEADHRISHTGVLDDELSRGPARDSHAPNPSPGTPRGQAGNALRRERDADRSGATVTQASLRPR